MNTNPAAPGGPDNTPEARQTGPVAKTINLGLDTAYALICGGMVAERFSISLNVSSLNHSKLTRSAKG